MNFKEEVLTENLIVHCQTKEQARNFLWWAHKEGYKWIDSEYFIHNTYWDMYKEKTCYDIMNGVYGNKESYEENNRKITLYEDVLMED